MSVARLQTIRGQPSWTLRASRVRAHLTKLGGHLGPITFRVGARSIAPCSVAPWAEEKIDPATIPLLRALRGDFFCAPFGDNTTPWRGERHLPHGEPANASWRLEGIRRAAGRVTLHASLATTVRRGRIDKFITLVDGQTAVYQRHVVAGRGPMPLGHHAMLAFPSATGSGVISTSRFMRGQVFPGVYGDPARRAYQSLRPGVVFRSLERVPLLAGGVTDLSRYPARRGFDDVAMLTALATLPFAWTAVTFPRARYVWFALRDPRVLRHTMLWFSNGGLHSSPWNGRHTAVMGLEDVTACFQYGLAESAHPNALNRRSIPTTLTLDPTNPSTINYIMAVTAIPAGFDRVAEIHSTKAGVELLATSGKRARCLVDLAFLSSRI